MADSSSTQLCPSINATINGTDHKLGQLDLCTVEGIPLGADTGATRVLGVNATLNDIPDNTCKVDLDG